uniref:Amidohydrolase family protein n=1 Tax=Rheinheimera sp. BAL341 TaxID=1708203 RepID=A0A486XWF8_9GAMM
MAIGVVLSVFTIWLWFIVNQLPDTLKPNEFKAAGVLFNNVHVLSMVDDNSVSPSMQAVLVIGDRITEVGTSGEVEAPEGVLVIDGQGKTLMPGLIDAHIHLNDETELAAYLAHGVTGVRNMSGYPFHLRLIKQKAQGQLLAPDFITTGPILNSRGSNENIIQTIVATADEARLAVRNQHNAGYRHIKVYSNLTPEAFDAIIDEAALLGMTVSGHSAEGERTAGIPHKKPFEIPWEASLGKRLTTLEHIETIVWHGLRDDLTQEKMATLARTLAQSGEAVTPTLIAHQRLVLIAQTKGAYLTRPGSDMINPLVTWFSKGAQQYWSQMDPSVYEAPHAEFFLMATDLLHQAGVPLLTGTDSGSFGIIPGESVARELELLVAAGLAPFEALASVTRRNAEILGFEKTGMILPGYRANLVLLDKNPLTDVGIVEHPVGVMIGGHWLERQELEALKDSARSSGISSFFRSLFRVIEMEVSS